MSDARWKKRKRGDSGRKSRAASKTLADYDAYMSREWGDRWPTLRASMLGPTAYVARINRFFCVSSLQALTQLVGCIQVRGR